MTPIRFNLKYPYLIGCITSSSTRYVRALRIDKLKLTEEEGKKRLEELFNDSKQK